MKRFTGVIVPVATPLDDHGGLEKEALERLVEYLLASGVHGLFANGSMSGFAFHPDRRQTEIIQAVAELGRGRVPVLAGISDTSVERVLEKAEAASKIAVDAFVALPPYYFLYGQAELLEYFRLIAKRVSRPLVVYENPRLVQNSLSPETIARLLEHPNIVAVKHSAANPEAWRELISRTADRQRVSMICGAEKMMAAGLKAGFDGMTGGFHNVVPKLAVSLWEAAQRGDWEECEALQERLNAAYRMFEVAGGWRGLEVALQYMGVARRVAVAPFDEGLPPEAKEEILAILRSEGVEQPYTTAAGRR
jgi:4-hydroxy-tetrahydrodipicolinate synthase